jgi:puromycin-sensitive aminopeptidase
MSEPISRRDSLRTIVQRARSLLAIPALNILDLVHPSLPATLTAERSKGEDMSHVSPSRAVDPYRLPRHVVPTRYDLHLEPDLKTATFAGEETVTLTITQPTAEIVLNAADLDVQTASLRATDGTSQTATIELDETSQRCRLTFAIPISPGTWTLRLTFSGILNDKLRGFYRSTYKDKAGTTHSIAATQFEATDARRAFPCWDEPDFKAVFGSSLIIDPSLTAVSNMAIASQAVENGKKIVRFSDTIRMSSYLVAFIVGRLESTDSTLVGQTPIRLWSIPGKTHLARFGQDIAAASLSFFERYYDIPYPGGKLDLLAIPDFASGAMENLGAITFRETALLVDQRTATRAELERVADVVAHENAHMWFGDLVTMSWWNGLWLNEAFATFMEMLAVDAWKPEWRRWESFSISRAAAFSVDGLQNTRPIEYSVRAPKDAEAMFDVLTYEKGASVLRMLEQHIGPTVFRDGVRDYLRTHAYGNADTKDLWISLGKAAKQPVPELMDGWIFQPGFPLVTASVNQSSELVLTQQRFSYLDDAQSPQAREQRWHIPIQMRIVAGGKPTTSRLLLKDTEARFPLPSEFDSLLLNESGHGFYRVRYAPDLLARLFKTGLDKLAGVERFTLINDAWAIAVAGLMPITEYLDLTAQFMADRDKNVWALLLESFSFLNRLIDMNERPALESLVRQRVSPAVADIGWTPKQGESELTGQLRSELIGALGKLGNDPATQERAGELYAALKTNPAAIHPDLVPAIVSILAFTGDDARYEEFTQRFRAASTPQEERRYLFSLAEFRHKPLLERTLARTLNGDTRTQDAPFLISAAMGNVHGRELAWVFVKTNWDQMDRLFPKQGLRRMCGGIAFLATPELERDVRAFFLSRKIDLGGKTLDQYLEQLQIAVNMQERDGKQLIAYLRASAGQTTGAHSSSSISRS